MPAPPRQAIASTPAGLDAQLLLRVLFDQNTDALLLVDPGGRIAAANAAAERLLGYAPAALAGLTVDELVPPALRARHAQYRAGFAAAPQARPMGRLVELVALRRDGSQVLVEIALSPLADAHAGWVLAALRDIGAYPRVRQALRRAQYSEQLARFGRLTADARDIQPTLAHVVAVAADTLAAAAAQVWLLQPGRRQLQVAAASGVELGVQIGEEPGSALPNAPGSLAGLIVATAAPVLVDDYAAERRFVVPPPYAGAGLRSAVGAPLSDRGHCFGALTVHAREPRQFGADELRFVESLAHLLATWLQRAQADEALSHSQRLESVGQLTGGIAHDFNNLLTVIQGNLQVLEELPAIAASPDAQPLVAAALRASRRSAELTAKLLAFSRRQVLQPSTLDLAQMLQSLAGMLRRTLDQRMRIEVDVPAGGLAVQADPGQLESALLNIAINARDAMPDGGTLRFRAQACGRLPPALRLTLDDPGADDERFVLIQVSDTGSGMSDEVKERAFEPFFTTKEASRGTGLGLSTVYGFARQSRGTVALDSSPGGGTTVTLVLPRPAAAAERDARGAAPLLPGRGLTVLLVEDDADVRAVVHGQLEALGCRVLAAASGEQAMLLLTEPEPIDLLLSDVALGAGMRGTRLAALATQARPGLQVLLMSGYSGELFTAERDGPLDVEPLRKPFGRDELGAAIARATVARSGT